MDVFEDGSFPLDSTPIRWAVELLCSSLFSGAGLYGVRWAYSSDVSTLVLLQIWVFWMAMLEPQLRSTMARKWQD